MKKQKKAGYSLLISQLQADLSFEARKYNMSETSNLHQQSLLSTGSHNAGVSPQAMRKSHEFQLTPLQQLIDKVGGEGRYQFRVWMIFNLMWFLTSWMLVGQGFFFDNQYSCFDIQNEKECEEYICGLDALDRPAAIKQHANSIVFAFESQYLICQFDYLRPILTSLLYIGSFLGFFVIPYVADNWGRKIAIRISWGLFIFGILSMCLADSPNMIGLGQLLAGFGCNPAITLCYSFINQQVLREKRQYYGVILQLFLALGQCIIAFMFLPKESWRIVLWILFGLTILNFLMLNYVEQSPKFLISRSKKQALEVLNNIAKKNKRQPLQQKQIQNIPVVDTSQSQGTSVYDLFKYKSLRWTTIGGGLVFLSIQVIYYGTLLNLDNIGYDKLVNQQIIGVSEAAGYIGAELIISKVFRKKWSFLGIGISSVLCFALALLTILTNDNNANVMKIIQTIVLIGNRFVLCGFWALFYVYIAQLYPTKVRSMGFGWASAMGTIGSTFAPYMIYYSQKANINSWIPPGVFGILGFACIFCLKQTLGHPLQDDIEEVKIIGKYELSDDEDDEDDEKDGIDI